ncbi:MAG TPA: hypothetical protein VN207_08840 [Ktedonobacteraceae bacterium]|nr:hypothetical protein [Ktedonobacteraceae bacterium]
MTGKDSGEGICCHPSYSSRLGNPSYLDNFVDQFGFQEEVSYYDTCSITMSCYGTDWLVVDEMV